MTNQTVILSTHLAESGWKGDPEASDNSPDLAIHGRRLWFLPEAVEFRIRDGAIEALASLDSAEEVSSFIRMQNGAEDAVASRDFAAAAGMLAEMLCLNPHCRWVRDQSIQILLALERESEAFDLALDGLRLDPENPAYHSLLAHALNRIETADPETVRGSLVRAVELGSTEPRDYALLARFALDDDRPSEALEWTGRSIGLQPDCIQALYARAFALWELERFAEAAVALEETVAAISPERGGLAAELGLADLYRVCCAQLLSATRDFPWKRIEREIALLGAEFGWSLDFQYVPPDYLPSESLLPDDPEDREFGGIDEAGEPLTVLGVDWLDRRAPGTVRLRLSTPDPRSAPAAIIQALMQIRQEARHLNGYRRGRHTGDPPRLREGVRRLVARQLAENPALAFPDDTPEVVRSIAFSLIEDLVGYPLDWLIVSETAARHPDLRFPGLFSLSLAAEQILEVFSELGDDISLAATGLLSAQTMLLAKLLFLADHSRGVLDLTHDLRGHPAFPRALQVRDHFREATRRPPRPRDEARLVTNIATIAGIIPAAARIETQGSFW